MRHAVSVIGSLLLAGCAVTPAGPEQLQRTWEAAHVRLLYDDSYVFGRMSVPANQQALSRIPVGVKLPTVIYLHGCDGLDWEKASQTMGRLVTQGFALLAPDSFARSNRRASCGRKSNVLALRVAEARHAVEQASKLPWVDVRNLFLIGHSEGGGAAAEYPGDQFNAIVVSGWGCQRGLRNRATTLVVLAGGDPWLHNSDLCAFATHRMILDGSQHYVLRDAAAAERVVRFLKDRLKP